MSPEVLTVAISSVAVAILAVSLMKRAGDTSTVRAFSRLEAALDEGRGFAWTVALCGLVYLVLQAVYGLRMPLADDEFGGAQAAYRVTELIPYRDFPPYKTVLGYYVQALPLLLTDNLWAGILLIRLEMAVINTLVLVFVAFRLRRHFRGSAICLALAALVVMSTFVERSFVLRVDMLGSLCGLLSLVFLLERRPAVAGALAGLGFLFSQKSAYFILAGGAALGTWWLWRLWRHRFEQAETARKAFFGLAFYSSAVFAVLIAYFGFWSWVGSFDQAVLRVAQTSADIGLTDRPYICSRDFWWQTLRRNPGFYGAAALALVTLAPVVWQKRRHRDWRLLAYGTSMVALSVWHKQPCPYFFVILIPTLFVLIVDLFERLRQDPRWPSNRRAPLVVLYLGLVLLVPLSRLPRTLERDNDFQSYTVALANALMHPEDEYLASLPVLYDRRQPVAEFRWLDDIMRRRLHRSSPDELLDIASRMDQARLKLVIMNYRMEDLPPLLRDYLVYHFAHFWGNVYLYAPFVGRGQSDFDITFDGLYQVDLQGDSGPATIDGQPAAHGQLLRLKQGAHRKSSAESLRLRFMPEHLDPALLEARYREPRAMFGFSFHY